MQIEFIVDHEIESEDFEGVQSAARIDFVLDRSERITDTSSDLRQEVSRELHVILARLEVLVEIRKRKLISVFELAVVFRVLLDGVVREMDEFVGQIIY